MPLLSMYHIPYVSRGAAYQTYCALPCRPLHALSSFCGDGCGCVVETCMSAACSCLACMLRLLGCSCLACWPPWVQPCPLLSCRGGCCRQHCGHALGTLDPTWRCAAKNGEPPPCNCCLATVRCYQRPSTYATVRGMPPTAKAMPSHRGSHAP